MSQRHAIDTCGRVPHLRPNMRVIAGEFGGRRLHAPHGDRTRPTSDRVREALFMALGPLDGMRVADLYAGSGALAIEAISRGAVHADLVEWDRGARATIARNVAELGLEDKVKVWPYRLPGALDRLADVLAGCAVVFADPPYGGAEARATLSGLGRAGVLPTGARVVLETHGKDEVPEVEGSLWRERERRYGETVVHVYRVGERRPPAEEPGP